MALSNPFESVGVAPSFWSGGPNPSGYYNFPGNAKANDSKSVVAGPDSHSQYPITTGT